MDVLIFDDDVAAADIVADVVESEGFSAQKHYHSGHALDLIRRLNPYAVVLDIMMPGLDGITLCQAIKSRPETRAIRVVIVTSKPYKQDQETALKVGATAFISKPYRIPDLQQTLRSLLSDAPTPREEASRPAQMRAWVGGASSDGPNGAATSAVLLMTPQIDVLFDAGTGVGELYDRLALSKTPLFILLTHYHADHISGLDRLSGLLDKRPVSIGGPHDPRSPLKTVVERLGLTASKAKLFGVTEAEFQFPGGVKVSALHTRHPGTTLAYRVEAEDRAVVYCPDNELELEDEIESDFSEKLVRFVKAADILIHDARYLDADFPQNRGKGHGCIRSAVDLAVREDIRRLVLFHADAGISHSARDQALVAARARAKKQGSGLEIYWGASGLTLDA